MVILSQLSSELFDNLPRNSDHPQLIIAKTIKGKGLSFMEDSRVWHLGHLSGADAEAAIRELNRRNDHRGKVPRKGIVAPRNPLGQRVLHRR